MLKRLQIVFFISYLCNGIRKQSINLITYNMNNKDLENANLYVLNGIICSYFDKGITPNTEDIKNNWQIDYLHISFEDSVIIDMINKVQKFY